MKLSKNDFLCIIKWSLSILLLIALILHFRISHDIALFLASTLGISLSLITVVIIFYLTDAFVALLIALLLFIFFCRSEHQPKQKTQHIQYTSTKKINDTHMFPAKQITLEEQTVLQMAPIDREQSQIINSTFKPIFSNNLSTASLL